MTHETGKTTVIATRPCKLCGKKVGFATDENEKLQCLDLVAPVYEVVDNPMKADVCMRNRYAFVSHFATCAGIKEGKRP